MMTPLIENLIRDAKDIDVVDWGNDFCEMFGFYIYGYHETPAGGKRARLLFTGASIYQTPTEAVAAGDVLIDEIRQTGRKDAIRAKAMADHVCCICQQSPIYNHDDILTCEKCNTSMWLIPRPGCWPVSRTR